MGRAIVSVIAEDYILAPHPARSSQVAGAVLGSMDRKSATCGLYCAPGIDLAYAERINFPFDGDGLFLRNSINSVDYDDDHWLHIVHKSYQEKKMHVLGVANQQTNFPLSPRYSMASDLRLLRDY